MNLEMMAIYIWAASILASLMWAIYAAKYTSIDRGDLSSIFCATLVLPLSAGIIVPVLVVLGIGAVWGKLFGKLRNYNQ